MLMRIIKDMLQKPAGTQAPDAAVAEIRADAWAWLRERVLAMFEGMHHYETENFDASRFRNLSPNAFHYELHAEYFLFVLRNADHFHRARQLLADQPSRELFDRLVLYRMLGHLHVRLPFNTPHNQAQAAVADKLRSHETSDVGPFGPLSVYVVPGRDGEIRVKGWKENVMWTFLYRQYFFSRDGTAVEPCRGDYVIDGGGCFGDTAINFADVVGSDGRVYVFDPLPKHCAIMREQLEMNPLLAPRISIIPSGLAEHSNQHDPLPADDVINPGARVVAEAMPLTTIDDTVAATSIRKVDFIKLDIEGSELGALRGGESTIRRFRPKLAISLYHRPEDFFSIPTWIDSLGVGYRMYLEHYTIHHEETVLYAVA